MFVSNGLSDQETFSVSLPDYGERRLGWFCMNVSKIAMLPKDFRLGDWDFREPCAMERCLSARGDGAAFGDWGGEKGPRRWRSEVEAMALVKGMTTYVAALRKLSFRYDSAWKLSERFNRGSPAVQAQSRSLARGKNFAPNATVVR